MSYVILIELTFLNVLIKMQPKMDNIEREERVVFNELKSNTFRAIDKETSLSWHWESL